MESCVSAVGLNIDNTFYGKFVKNQEKIRNLAIADPKSHAAVVVQAVDHFVTGAEMMKEHLGARLKSCCVERILEEFANSLRASEIFAIWTAELQRNVLSMARKAIEKEGQRSSALDMNARICYSMLMIKKDDVAEIAKAIKFMDVCKKKYPTEVHFWRTYCYLFSFSKDYETGLKAADEACKRFPTDHTLLNAKAQTMRMMTDVGDVDYIHWSKQKKQAEDVKQAFKEYLKVSPKDHRHFAENNYFVAYFAFKYAAPSSQMMVEDMQEITIYFQNGLNAEKDIIPCYLPFISNVKPIVAQHVNIHPTVNVYHEGNSCTIDMTTHGMPGRPKTGLFSTENIRFTDIRKPTKRRIEACVEHRQRLKNMLSDPVSAPLAQLTVDESVELPASTNDYSGYYEELILFQMTMSNVSRKFNSKMIQLTVVEDSLYNSGVLETIVADTTGDVIKLQVNLGVERPENNRLKRMMRKYRFGTVWQLRNPDFYMENKNERTMFIRTTPDYLIPANDSKNCLSKCRTCFKSLNPGQKCAKCKFAVYCGRECQLQDWKCLKHNLICCEAYDNFYK